MLRLIAAAGLALVITGTTTSARGDLPAEKLQRLLDLLTDHDYRVRLQAAIALGRLKDTRSVPALIRRLGDNNHLVRGLVAAALGNIGDTRAVAPLRELLQDRNSLVRRHARASLERIQKGQAGQSRLAGKRPILLRLGGVGDKTNNSQVLVGELRRLWTERISRTPGIRLMSGQVGASGQVEASGQVGASGQRIYEVNTAITELSSHLRDGVLETTCSVSVVLGDARGSIVMMTSGGATVQIRTNRLDKSQEPALRSSALENAVASAHSNIMKFLASR